MKSRWDIARDVLALFVHARRKMLGLTIYDVSDQARVSVACVSRAESQQKLSTENVLALCLWMGADPFLFLLDPDTHRPVRVPRGTIAETDCEDSGISGGGHA